MAERNVILALAKVIIAAAWADGDMTNEEINSVKDLVFRLTQGGYRMDRQITGSEWALLDMYIQSPVDDAERALLVEQLQAALRAPRDRALALATLEDVIQADGVVTDSERQVAAEIRRSLESVDLGIISQVGRLISGPLSRRAQGSDSAASREAHFEDFVRNRVYYAVRQRLRKGEAQLDIPDADLRKLSLAGGLMARVVHVNREVTPSELETIARCLRANWRISPEAAALVAEVAVTEAARSLDYYRLTREFVSSTTEDERVDFARALFAVADADGQISYEENDEIQRLAHAMLLDHAQISDARDQFQQARASTPGPD